MYVPKPFAQLLVIKDFCIWIFFFLICDNKESNMGYVGEKKARKSADGAWFS